MSNSHAIKPEVTEGGLRSMPSTKLGRLAVIFGAVFVVLFLINTLVFMPTSGSDAEWRQTILPFFGIGMMACGVIAGILGAVAMIRQRERSWLVMLIMLPGLFAIFFILGEFLGPAH